MKHGTLLRLLDFFTRLYFKQTLDPRCVTTHVSIVAHLNGASQSNQLRPGKNWSSKWSVYSFYDSSFHECRLNIIAVVLRVILTAIHSF